ncbi:MAG: hypothetical protein WA903_05915 [Ornithinimicrobium sp.]
MHAVENQDSVEDDYTGIELIGRVSDDGHVDFPLVTSSNQPDTLTVEDLRGWAADV